MEHDSLNLDVAPKSQIALKLKRDKRKKLFRSIGFWCFTSSVVWFVVAVLAAVALGVLQSVGASLWLPDSVYAVLLFGGPLPFGAIGPILLLITGFTFRALS